MDPLNLLQLFWSACTVVIGSIGCLVIFAPGQVGGLKEFFVYGKICSDSNRNWLAAIIEVPKRWFTHFYVISSLWTTIVMLWAFNSWYFNSPLPRYFTDMLKLLKGSSLDQGTDTAAVLTLALFVCHAYRRLWESVFLNVYSDSKMNIFHYLLGCLHYFLVPFAILVDSPGSLSASREITMIQWWGILLYVWSCYRQHQVFLIFASMRRNIKGAVTTYSHGIPQSDYFELVSCPHFLFEILIYVSLYLTLNLQHSLWPYVLTFVIVNQTVAATITHHWYTLKFGELYPANRKAIFPYLW